MKYTGERAIPWDRATGIWVMHDHVMRYAWALRRVWGKSVVDLGCGTGYGAFMLSWAAKDVVGVDIDPEAVKFARKRFKASNLSFEVGDVCQSVPEAEVYVAFEVIEHLDEPRAMLEKLDGTLLWSIPIDEASWFHKRAYKIHEIDALMGGAEWLQADTGEIVARGRAGWFWPKYALGVRRV